ncbi:alcohol oxidase [Pseudovirgaria hyperparasitica]|uniref:Alcohol oxidase n=1 Tax=Pseudovirgaria hyperparasitica TaxID=470096 RepID=A0A6A6WFV6_9PEZI|nr:alcohol oxidase [Pseudovirgaria hyperparasitica]KAF2760910.1 alcohol oxidase [Pseudovirgaria hyperparasitica]
MPDFKDRSAASEADFVIVGAGSASCLIASRLSQQLPNHRILVLEAGENLRDDPKIQTPGLSPSLMSDPVYDWQYNSIPEPRLNDRIVKHPRGKVVGGSSAINSHSVVFPNHEWQDRLVEELLPHSAKEDWGSQGMRDCYKRWQLESSESRLHASVEFLDHIKVSYPRALDSLQSRWMEAFEELGHATKPTGFTESSAGAVTVTNAIDSSKGERSHAGTAFLEPALERGNVVLKTATKVDRIVFDEHLNTEGKLVAKGVRYTHQEQEYLIRTGEVILCAGVFESPAILERSGIGCRKILTAARVPVLYELPGVGENLQDHINCGLSCETREGVHTRDEALRDPEERNAASMDYEQNRRGRLSEGGAYSFAFTPLQMLETSSETQILTNIVESHVKEEHNPSLKAQYSVIQKAIESPNEATATIFMLPLQRHRDTDSLPKDTPRYVDGNYVTVVAMLAHPFSRGSCHIKSGTRHHPEICFNYLSHPLDTEILARHLRLVERLFQGPTFTAITKQNGKRLPRSFPYPILSLEDAKNILPVNAATNYHPCGTCSMMREDLCGVVDERLIVYGTKNVRVCDASILPIIPRGNILTAVYAFAEKAAEIISRKAQRDLSSGKKE